MHLVYQASTTVEAYMILNLIEQEGLTGRIDGEYLQGGIGELDAGSSVRVLVAEDDYQQAKKIIQEWESHQPIPEIGTEVVEESSHFGAGLAGCCLGMLIMFLYYSFPIEHDDFDNNHDGRLDERIKYVQGIISKSEVDRNFDGEFDFIFIYNRRGILESALADEDFNGTFESEIEYLHGNVEWQKSDTNGDGFKDHRIKFKNGVLDNVRFYDSLTKKVKKIQYFEALKLKSAEVDLSGNGVLDTRYQYDSFEEVSRTSVIDDIQ